MEAPRPSVHFKRIRARDSFGRRTSSSTPNGGTKAEGMNMSIDEQLAELTEFVSLDAMKARLELPLRLMPEEPKFIIPSIEVGSDGLSMQRLTLVSDQYLCDVPLPANQEFDYVSKDTILNYRIAVWVHELKQPDTQVVLATYEVASVVLRHDLGSTFQTRFFY